MSLYAMQISTYWTADSNGHDMTRFIYLFKMNRIITLLIFDDSWFMLANSKYLLRLFFDGLW